MDTLRVETIGYFDRVLIDGSMKALKGSIGITVKTGERLAEAISRDPESHKHDVAKLRVELLGESVESQDESERQYIKNDRFDNGIKLMTKCKEIERYSVAFMEVSIIKGNYAFPFKKEVRDIEECCQKLDVTLDDFNNYLASRHLAYELAKLLDEDVGNINIAIIDRIYVHPVFRKCGISNWFHSNAAEIINVFAMMYIHGLVLTYGDFTNQAAKVPNYNSFLREHYIRQGYLEVTNGVKQRWNVSTNCVMYKVLV